MSPPNASSDDRKVSGTSRLIGSATSGALELVCFHPVDTIAKRLMSNQSVRIAPPGASFSQILTTSSQVIFKEAHSRPLLQRYLSLFPGLGFAAGYKILQRVYKVGLVGLPH
jgi:hypothetical protein